jgi:hypothetical protein
VVAVGQVCRRADDEAQKAQHEAPLATPITRGRKKEPLEPRSVPQTNVHSTRIARLARNGGTLYTPMR